LALEAVSARPEPSHAVFCTLLGTEAVPRHAAACFSHLNTDNSRPRWIIQPAEPILVTGAAGFIGCRVVRSLLRLGMRNLRCFVRPSSELGPLREILDQDQAVATDIVCGNLLSRDDCARAVSGAKAVIHLVTGRGKSFPGCFQNSVVTTRNLLDAVLGERSFPRLVNVSTFAVYSNRSLKRGAVLDETCELEGEMAQRYDAYAYAKLKQDELVEEYHRKHRIPYVTVRPTIVIGPGKRAIPGAVGLDTFGVFLHVGGGNRIPVTYVDNCADAIALAGLVKGVEGQVFNVVDDDIPTSRAFLRQYKRRMCNFRSIPVPYPVFYLFCKLWERYSAYSEGQLPPVFNPRSCCFAWRRQRYSNQKLKDKLGWKPEVPMNEALQRYFEYQRNGERHA
jgi:nucleoside-diphosphate-sugar epimerase